MLSSPDESRLCFSMRVFRFGHLAHRTADLCVQRSREQSTVYSVAERACGPKAKWKWRLHVPSTFMTCKIDVMKTQISRSLTLMRVCRRQRLFVIKCGGHKISNRWKPVKKAAFAFTKQLLTWMTWDVSELCNKSLCVAVIWPWLGGFRHLTFVGLYNKSLFIRVSLSNDTVYSFTERDRPW